MFSKAIIGIILYIIYFIVFTFCLIQGDIDSIKIILGIILFVSIFMLSSSFLKQGNKFLKLTLLQLTTPLIQITILYLQSKFISKVLEEITSYMPLVLIFIVIPSMIISLLALILALVLRGRVIRRQ